jgi:hypothetical protein
VESRSLSSSDFAEADAAGLFVAEDTAGTFQGGYGGGWGGGEGGGGHGEGGVWGWGEWGGWGGYEEDLAGGCLSCLWQVIEEFSQKHRLTRLSHNKKTLPPTHRPDNLSVPPIPPQPQSHLLTATPALQPQQTPPLHLIPTKIRILKTDLCQIQHLQSVELPRHRLTPENGL